MAMFTVSTMLVAALVILCCAVMQRALVTYIRFRRKTALWDKLPGLPYKFLYGNARDMPNLGEEGLQFMRDQVRDTPKIQRSWLGPFICMVNILHPDTAREILKTSEPKSQFVYRFLQPWLGQGLLVSSGERWARSRRLLTPAFHFQVLRHYVTVKNRASTVLLDKLERYARADEYFEVFSEVCPFSFDVLLQCTFSMESDVQTKRETDPYLQAVNDMNDLVPLRYITFWQASDFLYSLAPNGRKFKKCCQYVHKVAENIIEKRRIELAEAGSQRGNQEEADDKDNADRRMDFLAMLMTARDENGVGLSPLEIRNEVDTFLFEGHDTTTSAISWTLYSLASYPDVQKNAQQEVDTLLQGRQSDEITWEDLPKLTYLGMCIKEGMRLHSTIVVIQRETTKSMTVEGYELPAGSLLAIQLYCILHNPLVWEKPMEFIPERFTQEKIAERDPYAFIPFSAGPRNCIGQNFAMNEMKIVIARILRRFTLAVDPNHRVEKKIALVMKSQNGIRLKATPRNLG